MEALAATLSPQFDYIVFGALILALCAFVHRRFLRSRRIALCVWLIVFAVLSAGWLLVEYAGRRERLRMQQMVEGYAPTYARELERMGHAAITPETPADDPAFLAMIDAQKRWLTANHSINDIYTMRRMDDGKKRLIVDSETDYDRNGIFEGEREQRTEIGEEYEDTIEALDAAYETGRPAFEAEIVTDRWGTWVNAAAPLFDKDGRVEGIVGVDFDAAEWVAAIRRARLSMIGYLALLGGIAAGISGVSNRMAVRERAYRQREQEALEETHRAMVDSSRKAGMAEVATGVLHNVGNVLNSVNVSGNMVDERLRRSKLEDLRKVAALLDAERDRFAEFVATDPRGRLIPELVARLSDALAAEQAEITTEMRSVLENIAHIKEIVAMQQCHAKIGGVLEPLEVREIVEDALRIHATSLVRHGIAVRREFQAAPRILVDKHRVLQILVNVIHNAKQAMEATPAGARHITVSIEHTADERVRIAVADTGVGIAEENLTCIFNHGFTTKKHGHGFGLHSGALAATEMNGTLTVHSAGPGAGATFTLEIPALPAPPVLQRAA